MARDFGVRMQINILGPLRVTHGDADLSLGGLKQRTLLALLLVNVGHPVSVDRCIDAMWGESPPDGAHHSLQTYISKLRRLLRSASADGSPIRSKDGLYTLLLDAGTLDAERFRDALEDALAGEPGKERLDALSDGLALWQGVPLGEISHETWALPTVTELTELKLRAELARADDLLLLGRHEELAPHVEALLLEHPYNESLWERYLLALYRSGKQVVALREYGRLRDTLVEQLGVDPGPALQELELAMLHHDPALTPARSVLNNLPAPISTFIGRAGVLADLRSHVAHNRLVTVTGYGGSGKSRVAVELARRVASEYRDGVWMLELAPLTDDTTIVPTLLGELGLVPPVRYDPTDYLMDQIRPWESLLVFDNCEHLLAQSAGLIRRILETCPTIKVLATSRRSLTIGGEVSFQLPPLSLQVSGAEESEAVRLFADRASAVSGFELAENTRDVVLRLCERLDGMPLAIELAAARTATLTPSEIEERLDDRFRLLVEGDITAPERHRTLLGTVDWSYELLSDPARAIYRAMSAFRGGFTLDAAEAVASSLGLDAGQAEGGIRELTAHLLVIRSPGESPRYSMLETVREHGHRLLAAEGELPVVNDALLAWLRRKVWAANTHFGSGQAPLIRDVDRETDNVRAALAWALETDPDAGLELVAHMALHWWLQDSMPKAAGTAVSRLEEGAAWAQSLLATDGEHDAWIVARAKLALGAMVLTRLGRNAEAVAMLREVLDYYLGQGDRRRAGWAALYLAISGWRTEGIDEALRLTTLGLQLVVEAENVKGEAYGCMIHGNALAFAGDYESSFSTYQRGLDLALDVQDDIILSHCQEGLALAAVLGGIDFDTRTALAGALRYQDNVGVVSCSAHAIGTYAVWRASLGDLEEAAFAEGVAQGIRDVLPVTTQGHEDRTMFTTRFGVDRLDPKSYQREFRRGRALSLDGVGLIAQRLEDLAVGLTERR